MLTSFRWILIFCLLLLSAGCSTSGIIRFKLDFDPEEHSKVEDIEKFFVLYKRRWWNYYERGLAFMAGRHWEAAIGDFEAALLQMQDDQRGARTYGLNRIDYYANREAGIAYYKIREFTKARERLEDSLKSVESSRTQYYLRKVFKNNPNIDTDHIEPPAIKLKHPKASVGENGICQVEVQNKTVKLRILIEDEYFIEAIFLGGKKLFFELGKKSFEFEIYQKLDCVDCYKDIEIKASNLAHKENSLTIRLIRPNRSKQIVIQNRFFAGSTSLKPIVLTEIVAYPAVFENMPSLGRFAAKRGDYVLNLGQTDHISNESDEQPPDSAIYDYLPEELVTPEVRYKILVIPFMCLGEKKKLSSGEFLYEVLHKELGKAFEASKRFCYVEPDEDQLIMIKKDTILDNIERFNIEDVRSVVKEHFKRHEIDGILIGKISEEEEEEEKLVRNVEASLYDYDNFEDFKEILAASSILEGTSEDNIESYSQACQLAAENLVVKIESSFPLRRGKVTRWKPNYFVCQFEEPNPKYIVKNKMKLIIFDRDADKLDTQGKIYYLPSPKKKAEYYTVQVQARYHNRSKDEKFEEGVEYFVITK